MIRNEILAEIYKLDLADRQFLVDAISATLPEKSGESQLSPEDQEIREIIERRREAYRRNPESFVTLDEFKKMLQERRAKAKT
jgi:hypothetical protein